MPHLRAIHRHLAVLLATLLLHLSTGAGDALAQAAQASITGEPSGR